MKLVLTGALALGLLAGCAQPAENTDTADDAAATQTAAAMDGASAPSADAAAPTDAAGYLAMAGAGDLFEIESSRAILAKSPDKAVADFADMMIKQHTDSTAKLKAAAGRDGVTVPPPQMTADQQAKVDGIKAATGASATDLYLTAQREAHPQALALHRGYAAAGDKSALKATAGEIVPVVQEHIATLQKMPGGVR